MDNLAGSGVFGLSGGGEVGGGGGGASLAGDGNVSRARGPALVAPGESGVCMMYVASTRTLGEGSAARANFLASLMAA